MSVSLFNTTVLVTGADGFTGRYVRAELSSRGAVVYPLRADLRDLTALKDELSGKTIDYVIHLAAISFVPHGTDMDVYAINLFGTQNLLEALRHTSPSLKKVILASSANIYGNATLSSIDETLCPAPVNHYGISKLAMEHMAMQFKNDFDLMIARPFNYTGVGQADHFLIPKIVSHFTKKASTIELGNIDVARDFSDVRWIAQAYGDLLVGPAQTETVNLCSAQAYTIREIIRMLERITEHTVEIIQNPAFMRAGEISYLRGNSDKLHTLAPTLPPPVSMYETLKWMSLHP